jgi:hypothetical protein
MSDASVCIYNVSVLMVLLSIKERVAIRHNVDILQNVSFFTRSGYWQPAHQKYSSGAHHVNINIFLSDLRGQYFPEIH